MSIRCDFFAALAQQYGFTLSAEQLAQFDCYASFLVEYNEKVNLTAITEPDDIAIKHFLDSLLLLKAVEVPEKARLIDVGTGAGFPAVPVKIARPDLNVTLLDGLNKRIVFLQQLSQKLGQQNECIHGRAEEAAKTQLREQFDIATARAVADLRVLAEYCLPFVKTGGYFLALKGPDGPQEAKAAEKAVSMLGGKISGIYQQVLPGENQRSIIVIQKCKTTPAKYPRHGGKIAKSPL